LLAFLAAGGLPISATPYYWYFYPFLASLILLSFGVIFGVLAMWPVIPISGSEKGTRPQWQEWLLERLLPRKRTGFGDEDLWLDSLAIKDRALWLAEDSDALLRDLFKQAAGNANGNLDLRKTVIRRRKFINWEILLMALALIALIIALIGWGAHITPS
jgi:hypothetical protein